MNNRCELDKSTKVNVVNAVNNQCNNQYNDLDNYKEPLINLTEFTNITRQYSKKIDLNRSGKTTAGQNTTGQNTAGQTTAGQTTTCQNTTGQNTAGQNTTGQNTAGQNTTCQTTAGQTTTCQNTTGQNIGTSGKGINSESFIINIVHDSSPKKRSTFEKFKTLSRM
jgi:hypothetical protein